LAFAVASAIPASRTFHTVLGDVVPIVVMVAAVYFCVRNAFDSRGHTRLFWSLMGAGLCMWLFNQFCWAWYEVLLGHPLPQPSVGDDVLFLHVVPMTAAVAIRPRQGDEKQGMVTSTLNVVILLVWWVVVYAYFVFPAAYVADDHATFNQRWDLLYLIQGIILIGVSGAAYVSSSGAWRKLYCGIFLSSFVYVLASEAINRAILLNLYRSGGPFDIPFFAAVLGFLGVAIFGRRMLAETREMKATPRRSVAPFLAQLALLSLPFMGYASLFLTDDPLYLRQIRFAVSMGGVTILAFVVFLKQHLLDQRLLQLLTDSRQSYDNLQRLQGRAVQQAKLASLGELVALAANELEHPLAAIVSRSEQMSGSSNLTREQLNNAQKIGQQARRTRELVNGLLSFAQQTSGEKAPLELKPLLQRAVQMEGFKLDKRNITLTVEGTDPLPRVLGDSNQLLQAFVQIVENAVEALQEIGGGRLQISLWREGNDVVIQFADNGLGLRDPERVFDPFYTTKPVGKGTGLGLSATYGVVRDHQGQITCFNRPEGGAAFEIRLPALKSGVAVAASESA
jgi:signal transduction histidine kinase